MHQTYISLDPVPVTLGETPHSARENRTFQGIPGINRTAKGRLFALWYTGGTTECRENYVTIAISDDDGLSWLESAAIIDPPHPAVRAFDPALWTTPDGRFLVFWAQSCGGESGNWEVYDGIAGVWFSELENPDDDPEKFRFTPPRRISNGVMMNKPTVLEDGTWALPCSAWSGDHPKHESLEVVQGAYMVVSTDNGATFSRRGLVDMNGMKFSFDEHMFVRLQDGRLACYCRVQNGTSESFSEDNGRTWSSPVLSATIPGIDSRFFIRRLKSGRLLLIANDPPEKTPDIPFSGRRNMTAFLSDNDGKTWHSKLLLLDRDPDVSYPDAVETEDGFIYVIYDSGRRVGGHIFCSKITEADILAGKLLSPGTFLNREVSHTRPVED